MFPWLIRTPTLCLIFEEKMCIIRGKLRYLYAIRVLWCGHHIWKHFEVLLYKEKSMM